MSSMTTTVSASAAAGSRAIPSSLTRLPVLPMTGRTMMSSGRPWRPMNTNARIRPGRSQAGTTSISAHPLPTNDRVLLLLS